MEIRYPFVILIVLAVIIGLLLFTKKKDKKYKDGSKIANTEYLKSTPYYKKRLTIYKAIKTIFLLVFVIAIITATILTSRLSKVETNNLNEYSRDIFLCMDISTSVDDLNIELLDSFANNLDKFKGERVGLSVFNTSSVIVIPLTEDYDYLKEMLQTMKKTIKTSSSNNYLFNSDDNYLYNLYYVYGGTQEGNKIKGSSLIGDGLASCVFSFPKLDEQERTRVIIFSTDNELQGDPLVTLDKAAKISKSKNVKVYGIGTKNMILSYKTEMKNAVEKTGGKFYEHSSSTVASIIEDIETTTKSFINSKIETKQIDIPKIPFIILLISIFGIVIISKKV